MMRRHMKRRGMRGQRGPGFQRNHAGVDTRGADRRGLANILGTTQAHDDPGS